MVEIEKVEIEWYDQAVLQPKDRIQRMKIRGKRFYQIEGEGTLYKSVTTIIGEQTGLEEGLLRNYVCRFPSYDEYKRDLNEKADRGTVMHALLAEMVKGYIDFPIESEEFRSHVCHLIENCDRDPETYWQKWERFLKYSLYAFLRWVHEKEIKFFCIEIPLVSRKYGAAGQEDCCGLTIFRGKPRLMITDFKSGQLHGTYPDQLGMYYVLLE